MIGSWGWKLLEVLGLLLGVFPALVAGALWLWGEGLGNYALAAAASGVAGFVGGAVAGPHLRRLPRCARLSKRRLNAEYNDYLRRWGLRVHAASTSKIDSARVEEVMLPASAVMTVAEDDDGREVLDLILKRMKHLRDTALPIACVLKKDKLIGVITPSDLDAKTGHFHPAGRLEVSHLMTSPTYTHDVDDTWGDAEDYRRSKNLRSGLPVIDKKRRLRGFLPPMGGRDRQGP